MPLIDAESRSTVTHRLQSPLCPVCAGSRVYYAFSNGGVRVLQCVDCHFTFRTQPISPPIHEAGGLPAPLESGRLRSLLREASPAAARELRPVIVARLDATGGVRFEPDPGADGTPKADGGRVVFSFGELERFCEPLPVLKELRRHLQPTDTAIFVHSDIRRAGIEVGSKAWERLLGERNAYLDTPTALTVLYRAGFRCLGVQRLRRRVSLDELLEHQADHLVFSRGRRWVLRALPAGLRRRFRVNSRSTEVAIIASPRQAERPLVSVVVPVYNEAATVAAVLDAVLRVELAEADIEIVVVESNSSDGSREIVRRYADHPRVTCLFEDRPRGKGHATRLGLSRARGDILLVQDADLEYDFEDYHALLGPIIQGHQAFVLGSRHGGRHHWKLRRFSKPFLAGFYNLAHVLVTSYINVLFRLRLRDPQTMFKVCRRDCVEGLSFHANYFNFDYEFLLKIVRRGYLPTEIPVNYRSRSHAEGKKIRLWRDAPLGLWTITRLRFTPLARFLRIGERIE